MNYEETMSEYDGFMCCRAMRPSTESWLSIRLPDMSQMATPEEATQWVIDNYPGFIPIKIQWIDSEKFEDGEE